MPKLSGRFATVYMWSLLTWQTMGHPENGLGLQGPAYEEQEGQTYLGEAFTKCKPVWKREGLDNPEFTRDDVLLDRPLKLRWPPALS